MARKQIYLQKGFFETEIRWIPFMEFLPVKISHGNLQARIRQAISEIRKDDSRILLEPLAAIEMDLSWPGPEILRGAVTRIVMWRQSIRRAVVAFVLPGSEDHLSARIWDMLQSGEAEFALVLAMGSFNSIRKTQWYGDSVRKAPIIPFLSNTMLH